MAESHGLEPPLPKNVGDPGAHQLAETSDSEDQFMDAQSLPGSPDQDSPNPEAEAKAKEDGEPLNGEASVPETHGARQDEIEQENDDVTDDLDPETETPSPSTPKTLAPIPITIVEESSGEAPKSKQNHDADASPDIILGHREVEDEEKKSSLDLPAAENLSEESLDNAMNGEVTEGNINGTDDDLCDEFDDDFDDFEEGDGQDEDFGDFTDSFQHPQPPPSVQPAAPVLPQGGLPFSIPNFDGPSPDEVTSTIDPCLSILFPPEELGFPSSPPIAKDTVFLTPRSASLWSQLVAPPPLAPPDWIRSHTRRLFLVSLGVPVDLDEILPASKQKKLILPSINISATSPRSPSFPITKQDASSGNGAAAGASTTAPSVDEQSTSSQPPRRRKGPPPEPKLDLVTARLLCQTTDEALDGMTGRELKAHVGKLEAMEGVAKESLDYWAQRTDEQIGDRETFEGVIENLVAHARKVRK